MPPSSSSTNSRNNRLEYSLLAHFFPLPLRNVLLSVISHPLDPPTFHPLSAAATPSTSTWFETTTTTTSARNHHRFSKVSSAQLYYTVVNSVSRGTSRDSRGYVTRKVFPEQFKVFHEHSSFLTVNMRQPSNRELKATNDRRTRFRRSFTSCNI